MNKIFVFIIVNYLIAFAGKYLFWF